MKDKVTAGYNKAAKAYQLGRDQFTSDPYLEKLNSLLKPNSSILDIGCGSGKPVDAFFANHGHRVTGIDISEEQIELAQESVPDATFKLQDMSELKMGEYSVDAIVSFYAVFHIPREQHLELFKKMHSFLPAGGLLLVTMGSSDWQGSEEFFGVEMQWSHYGREENTLIVKKAGFELLLDEIDETGGERHQVILARKVGSFENLVLDDEEQALETAFEKGEYKEDSHFEDTKKMLEEAATRYLELNTPAEGEEKLSL